MPWWLLPLGLSRVARWIAEVDVANGAKALRVEGNLNAALDLLTEPILDGSTA